MISTDMCIIVIVIPSSFQLLYYINVSRQRHIIILVFKAELYLSNLLFLVVLLSI